MLLRKIDFQIPLWAKKYLENEDRGCISDQELHCVESWKRNIGFVGVIEFIEGSFKSSQPSFSPRCYDKSIPIECVMATVAVNGNYGKCVWVVVEKRENDFNYDNGYTYIQIAETRDRAIQLAVECVRCHRCDGDTNEFPYENVHGDLSSCGAYDEFGSPEYHVTIEQIEMNEGLLEII